jgi:hypothetical protein
MPFGSAHTRKRDNVTNETLYSPTLRECEKAFLHYLYARGAKHVVIGGHAVLLYAGDREVGVNDLDVVIECSHENAVRVFAAIQDCGVQLIYEQAEYIDRLSQPNTKLCVPYGGPIEILTSTKSEVLSFDDLWRDRCLVSVSVAVGDSWGESVFDAAFVSKAHLLQLKREAISDPERDEKGREQDKNDVESLQ